MIRFISISLLVLLFNFNSYSEWFTQNSGTNVSLNALYFNNLNTGYTAGNNGVILKTTNKGLNWISLTTQTNRNLFSICFTDINNGYAIGDSVILKTTDAGSFWSSYFNNYPMTSVYFINSQVGYITAYNGAVIKTTNAGTSWIAEIPGSSIADYTAVYFVDINTGFVVGLSGRYLKTTDGGQGWIEMPVFYQKNYYSVQFPTITTGYIIGGWINNMIMKSTDEGETFEYVVSGQTGVRLFSSSFLDVSNGIAVGRQGNITRTTDAGATWVDETSGTGAILYGVQYLNSSTVYAVGENGTILSTVQVIGINPISSYIPSEFSLSQNYPNPFNPMTKIKFQMPNQRFVKLVVFDMLGREASVLVNEELKPGTYEVNFYGSKFSSGTYFYTLIAGEYRETKSMILLK